MTESISTIEFVIDHVASLPSLKLDWYDEAGVLCALQSQAYAFTAQYLKQDGSLYASKSTGFTAADTAPNLTLAWTVGEFTNFPVGAYTLKIIATRASDNRVRVAILPFVIS